MLFDFFKPNTATASVRLSRERVSEQPVTNSALQACEFQHSTQTVVNVKQISIIFIRTVIIGVSHKRFCSIRFKVKRRCAFFTLIVTIRFNTGKESSIELQRFRYLYYPLVVSSPTAVHARRNTEYTKMSVFRTANSNNTLYDATVCHSKQAAKTILGLNLPIQSTF